MHRRGTAGFSIAAGGAGSLLVALAGAGLTDRDPIRWWFHPHLGVAWLYLGLVLLCGGWLGLGAAGLSRRRLMAAGLAWSLPLVAGPPLFSHDVFSYLAQGLIVHLGIDPYQHGPSVLALHGESGVLRNVSPFWRDTPAPYGPGFLGLAAIVAAFAAHAPVLAVFLFRIPELGGMLLLAFWVPRLARACGADPARAVWLVVLSPLALVELVSSAHNDALMAGLLAAGVCLAVTARPVHGAVCCALAASVKLPAGLGVVFILVAAWRSGATARVLLAVALAGVLVPLAVTAISGLGLGWISGGVISTPARVRLSITPATDIGFVLARVLHAAGIGADAKQLEFSAAKLALVIPAGFLLGALARLRQERLVRWLGTLLLLLVVFGPASWPWYGVWGLCLLACVPGFQARRWPLAAIVVSVFLIRADGRFALPLRLAPWVLAVYVGVGLVWVLSSHRPSRPAPLPVPVA